MSRDGKTTPLRPTPSDWSNPAFAPDGRRLAFDTFDGEQNDVWVYDWTRETPTLLMADPSSQTKPVWSPMGRYIVFASNQNHRSRILYWRLSDGSGNIERLTEGDDYPQLPTSWHPSGKFLAFSELNPKTQYDIMILPIEGDETSGFKPGKPTALVNDPANQLEAMFSPDGRWIAYQSNESGQNQIFVQPFPGPGSRTPISPAGGTYPTWSRVRHELFYVAPDNRIMVVSYTVAGDSFNANAEKPQVWSPQPILPRPRYRWLDLHPDGERFVVAAPTAAQTEDKRDKIVFIFNFFDELRRIAPVAKATKAEPR
jgi:serine/threonine-protein kinase